MAHSSVRRGEVSWVEDDEVLSVPPGPWRDVNGLHEAGLGAHKSRGQVITTLPGEKVLALCTMHYVANWSSRRLTEPMSYASNA